MYREERHLKLKVIDLRKDTSKLKVMEISRKKGGYDNLDIL